MADNSRDFEVGPDPFGRTWRARFRWLQNAISIRHADTVDVKFALSAEGEPLQEKVIALHHPVLKALAVKTGSLFSDAWCMKLAALHVRHMVESFEDMEKALVTVPENDLARYALKLRGAPAPRN